MRASPSTYTGFAFTRPLILAGITPLRHEREDQRVTSDIDLAGPVEWLPRLPGRRQKDLAAVRRVRVHIRRYGRGCREWCSCDGCVREDERRVCAKASSEAR